MVSLWLFHHHECLSDLILNIEKHILDQEKRTRKKLKDFGEKIYEKI